MVTRSDAIRIMHEVKNLCSEILPVKEAYLYGSYARGDFHSESDVDILVTADILPEDVSYYRSRIAQITSELSLVNDVTVSVTLEVSQAVCKVFRSSAILQECQNRRYFICLMKKILSQIRLCKAKGLYADFSWRLQNSFYPHILCCFSCNESGACAGWS